MSKYEVPFVGSAYTVISVEIDSDDPVEIIEAAYDRDFPTLCAQCSGWNKWDPYLELGEEWVPDQFMGKVSIMKVEE